MDFVRQEHRLDAGEVIDREDDRHVLAQGFVTMEADIGLDQFGGQIEGPFGGLESERAHYRDHTSSFVVSPDCPGALDNGQGAESVGGGEVNPVGFLFAIGRRVSLASHTVLPREIGIPGPGLGFKLREQRGVGFGEIRGLGDILSEIV